MAAIFFGGEAFSYHNYSWIAILVNVPATIFATGYYELLMRDSLQKISKGHAEHEDGHEGLMKHLSNVMSSGDMERSQRGYMNATSQLGGPQGMGNGKAGDVQKDFV